MSLIDLASMVLAPTAVKDGKVYNAIPNDQDFTFSRGTEATRVNSAGLIEKARTNRLLQSNNFNTTWGTGFSTLTSGQVGYNGTNDAWKVESTTIGGETRIRQSQTFTTGEVITLSVYMKKGNVNFGIVRTYAITGGGRAWFDLENGTVETENSGINGSIEDVGNGWYRCSIWGVIDTTGAVDIAPAPADGDYLADAVGEFIYIQDSQLESGLVATDVITTTTSSVTVGITDDLPRVDYSGGGCPSLLLEPSRTQLLPHSEYFEEWTLNNVVITNNDTTSPEGLDNAAKWAASSGLSQKTIYEVVSCSSGVAHTTSVYFKADEYPLALIRLGGITDSPYVIYDLRDESVVSTSGLTSHTIESVVNNWYRIDATATTTGTVIAPNFAFLPESGYTLTSLNIPQYTGDGTSGGYIYGAMVEAGSYVSSYINSYGTSTTRVADLAVTSNASNLIGQTEGTMFIEFTRENNSVGTFSISANNVGTRIYIGTNASGLICQVRNGYAQQAYFSTAQTEGTKYKCAIAYATNDFVLYMNGTQIGTDTSGTVPACNTIRTDDAGGANLNQPLKQAILFPTRLTNDQLEELTK